MGKCRYDLTEDCNSKDCLACVLDKIRYEIVNLPDINPDYPMDKRVHICKGEALYIIDKYRKGEE